MTEDASQYESFLARRHRPAHARRTAERNAAFLLPHLRPGMRLLDAGCGPGSITIGLAAAVAPGGEAIGFDADASAIDQARVLAAERAIENARFETGDIHRLPYADGSFDAAFVHAVLQHLANPLDVLREVRRVLRPGAVIGIADADYDASVMYPQDPLLDRATEITAALHRLRSGGDPRVGKRLRALLHEAGFVRTEASVLANVEGNDERVRRTGEWLAAGASSPEYIAEVTARGIATEPELLAIAEAQRRWSATPGAIWATMWCQAIGWVPDTA
jgi:ubiquinone/menaquinone biosynthesis C-methylase UbiE